MSPWESPTCPISVLQDSPPHALFPPTLESYLSAHLVPIFSGHVFLHLCFRGPNQHHLIMLPFLYLQLHSQMATPSWTGRFLGTLKSDPTSEVWNQNQGFNKILGVCRSLRNTIQTGFQLLPCIRSHLETNMYIYVYIYVYYLLVQHILISLPSCAHLPFGIF